MFDPLLISQTFVSNLFTLSVTRRALILGTGFDVAANGDDSGAVPGIPFGLPFWPLSRALAHEPSALLVIATRVIDGGTMLGIPVVSQLSI